MTGDAVSIIATVRGEPRDRLERMIDALAEQTGVESLELVIAAPQDELVGAALQPRGVVANVVTVANPTGERSAGLNLAARAASHAVLCRVDARSVPEANYVAVCRDRLLSDPDIGVVGGIQVPRAADSTIVARGTARALANPWMLGGAAYRGTGRSGPVDTVYLGCFRRDEFLELGGYDERLAANEDFDLAERYRRAGLSVWLEGGLRVPYEARESIVAVFSQYHEFGRAKVRYWRLRGTRPNGRQSVALCGALASVLLVLKLGPRRAALFLAGCTAAWAALDHVVDPAEPDVRVRASALLASAAVTSGWVSGVCRELAGSAKTATVVSPSPRRR